MTRQSHRLFLAAVLLALPALACSIVTGTSVTTTPLSSQPVATETITPVPTSTPAATNSLTDLTTYDNEALGLQFQYPQTWELVENNSSVTVATDSALLETETFDREGAGVAITVGPDDQIEIDSLEDALIESVSRFGYSSDELTVETFNTTSINGQEAAVASIRGQDNQGGQTLLFYSALLRQEKRAAFATGITLEQYAEEYRPALEAITHSIRISTPTTPEVPAPEGRLEYGESVQGSIEPDTASAWSFIGVEGERINVRVTPLGEQLDVTLDVLDGTGTSLLESGPIDEAFGTEEVRSLVVPANDEYLVVVRGFARSSGDFELELTEAGEPGSAETIRVNQSRPGTVEPDQHVDYAFSSSESRTVTVLVDPEGELDVVVEVLDETGAVIVQEDSSYSREQLMFDPEAGAQYVIRVRGFAGASGDYTVSVTPGGISSNDPSTRVVASDSLPENSEAGHDFPFSAVAGSTIYATVVPEGEFDVVVQVWNDDADRQEDQIDLSFGREEVTFIVPDTGNYYFKVLGFEGQGGDYTITMSGPPTAIFELVFGDEVEGRLGEEALIEYSIRLEQDEAAELLVEPDEETDVMLEVLDLDNNVLAETDEGFSGEPEQLRFAPSADISEARIFIIRIIDFFGEGGGSFTMTLEEG